MEPCAEKPKSVWRILFEALELWKDHMFPLVLPALFFTALLIVGNVAIVHFFGPAVGPSEADAVVVSQQMMLTTLFILLLILITALLDALIWSYFSGLPQRKELKSFLQFYMQRFSRILQIDLIFIGSMIAVLLSMLWLLTYSNIQNLEGLQFFGIFIFYILLAGLLLFIFTPYRFIIRPFFALSQMSLKASCRQGYRLFFASASKKTIGLMILSYLIVFIFTPQTSIIWVQHVPFVIMGPYIAMIVWVFFRQLHLPDTEEKAD